MIQFYIVMSREIIILVGLLLLSAYFSAAETAMVSLSASKIRALVEQKKTGSALLQDLKKHPHKLLITILVGSNLVNVLASVYSTIVFQKLLGSAALGVITGVLTLVILIFGEIIPKTFSQQHSVMVALFVAPPLYLLSILFTPLIWVLDGIVKGFLFITGKLHKEKNVTEDELKAFVSLGAEEGSIEKDEQELIENVLEFGDTRVEEIMVPRVQIQALSLDSTFRETVDFVMQHHHSRIPVYRETIDNIVGVLTVKDLLRYVRRGRPEETLWTIPLLEPLRVPGSKKINDLFAEFQKRRVHLAIVLDEHGGTRGLITLEDILEELVGEIEDEFDKEAKPQNIRKIGTMEVEATGKATIEEINEALDIKIPGADHRTISYYVTETLGHFPKRGEVIEGDGFTVTVDEMRKHTIVKVTVEKS